MAGEWHVPEGPALVCAHCGSDEGLRLDVAAVEGQQIPNEAQCFECGAHFTVALIDEHGDPFTANLGASTPLEALLKARHPSTPLPVLFGEGDDRDGKHWRVSGRAGWVRVEADSADLDQVGQEQFAQAYVAACRAAEADRHAGANAKENS